MLMMWIGDDIQVRIEELFHGTRSTHPKFVYDGEKAFDRNYCSSGSMISYGIVSRDSVGHRIIFRRQRKLLHTRLFI